MKRLNTSVFTSFFYLLSKRLKSIIWLWCHRCGTSKFSPHPLLDLAEGEGLFHREGNMATIIDHNHPVYRMKWNNMAQPNRYNGAFYYSKEIVKNIIPNVKTDRPWLTIMVDDICEDRAIVFIHNNLHPERYDYLKNYKDLILVCGVPETMEKVEHLGTPIYLPLSIDVEYVKQFTVPKEKRSGSCYVGRPVKRTYTDVTIPEGVDIIEGVKRQNMLPMMATYETVYAVGRCAVEAKALGCKLKAYDPRFPKVSRWKVIDNKEAAKMLQKELDRIDG